MEIRQRNLFTISIYKKFSIRKGSLQNDNFDGFKKSNSDAEIEQSIESLLVESDISQLETLKLFPVYARRQWLKRFLAHHELFRLTSEVPGDIVELGVFKGAGLFTWANLLEAYNIGDRTKVVFGFDNWKGFTGFDSEDGSQNADAHKVVGGFDPSDSYQSLLKAIEIFDRDRFIGQKPRIKLVNGQIEETVPKFIEENPGIRISLAHFDCDLFAPTLKALEALWSRVSRGGVLIFDEYAIPDWPGETAAVDKFLEKIPGARLKTFDRTNTPGAYLIKS